jgi:nucleoside-diphosphate-sugar epimerase
MKVLLVGGSGHIGGRLAQELVCRDISVTVTTRQATPMLPAKVEGIAINDVLKADWNSICADHSHIVNLVSPRERDCNLNPDLARNVVEAGSLRLVQAAHKHNLRFIYLSTSQVYGSLLHGQISEFSPTSPSNAYAAVHLAAENVIQEIAQEKACIVRLANSVGLPATQNIDTWQLLVHDIAREVASSGRLTLRTAGLQHRSFIAVSEVVDALLYILNSEDISGVVNVSNPSSMSVRNMAQRVSSLYDSFYGARSTIQAPERDESESENPFELLPTVLTNRGVRLGQQHCIDEEIIAIFRQVLARK